MDFLREITDLRRNFQKMSSNMCLFGQEGSGTYFMIREMVKDILEHTHDIVIAISTTDNLNHIAQKYGGLQYHISPVGKIEPIQYGDSNYSFIHYCINLPHTCSSDTYITPYRLCLKHLDFQNKFLQSHLTDGSKRIWLFFEDISIAMADVECSHILERIFVCARPKGMICTGYDHFIKGIINHPAGMCILANSPYIMLMHQSVENAALLSSLFQLKPEFQTELISLSPLEGFISLPDINEFHPFTCSMEHKIQTLAQGERI